MDNFNEYYTDSYSTNNRTGNPAPLPSMVFGEFMDNNLNSSTLPTGNTPTITLNEVFTQNQQLQNQINLLNNSVVNMQNLLANTNTTVSNIENMLYQSRDTRQLRPMNRYSTYNRFGSRDESRLAYLERLNSLLNSTSYIPRPRPRRHIFNDDFQNNIPTTPITPTTPTTPTNSTQTRTPNNGPPSSPPPPPPPTQPENQAPSPSRIEALIFRSLVESLNNQLPVNTQVYPNVLEVSYSTENVSNDIVNFIRNLNEGETPENVITTHATISNNTEVIQNDPNEMNEEDGTMDNICVICQEEITGPCILRKIKKCGHKFHLSCLDKWLENKITCPSCRADIRLNENNDTNNDENNNEINDDVNQRQDDV